MTGPEAGLEIRPVTPDDLEPLIDIYLDTAVHHATIDPQRFRVPEREAVAERLGRRIDARGESAEYLAAIVDGTMAGSGTVDVADPIHPGNMARPIPTAEFGVSVLVDWRGRGIGRALIGHLEAWAADRGIEQMILSVSEANVDAIRLYRELGYVDAGREMRKDPGRR